MCLWRRRRVSRPVLPSFFLCCVSLTQLLALAVDDANVDGELVAHNWATAVALTEFDASDLRWQLATFSHGELRSEPATFEITTPPRCAPR